MAGKGIQDLGKAVVVITGASSGIGRAAALAFARRGAKLALAARRSDLLHEVARECERQGGRAIAVPTDVTDPGEVQHLARLAAERLGGRIDVWINNAGVGAVGRFTQTPMEAHEQVIRTNLIGTVHGAHAALPHFLRQGAGVLINNLSFGAWVPAPFAAAYSASKFGLRGLTDSLRAELSAWPGIHVCDVFPSFMDTPGVQHGANYTGRVLKPAPPIYDPALVAEAMVRLAQRPRNATTIGLVATAARLGYALAPAVMRWAMARFMEAYLLQADRAPVTDGNLFRPIERGREATGGWRSPGQRMAAAAGATALGLLAGAYAWRLVAGQDTEMLPH